MNPCDPSLREIDHRDDLPEWMILHYRKVGVDILMEPAAFIGVLHAEYEQKFAAWGPLCHLIDPWHEQPADVYRDSQNAQAHLESAYWTAKNRLPNATFHRMLSLEAAPLFEDASLSLVHLDGNHSHAAVSADIAAWWPKVRPGGILAGHDLYCRQRDANSDALNAVLDFAERINTRPHVTWCTSYYFRKPV
jgi:hypothetical protein